jgi:hypothetical protein
MRRASIVRCDCLISRAWIGGPARSGLDGYWAREGTGDRCFVAGVNCGVCKHLVPPFLFYLEYYLEPLTWLFYYCWFS